MHLEKQVLNLALGLILYNKQQKYDITCLCWMAQDQIRWEIVDEKVENILIRIFWKRFFKAFFSCWCQKLFVSTFFLTKNLKFVVLSSAIEPNACCAGQKFAFDSDWNCCGGVLYRIDREACCYGSVYTTLRRIWPQKVPPWQLPLIFTCRHFL